MKISLFTFLCFLTVSLCSRSLAADATTLSSKDKTFVKEAGMGGLFEVELGKVAADKGMSQDVKDFGSEMVTDHGKVNDELKSIATAKGLEVPSQLDAKHQKVVDKLSAKSGAAFDKAYLAEMTKDHDGDHAAFVKEAKSGKDADIKAFAAKTDQEVIQHHIQMLKDIKSKAK